MNDYFRVRGRSLVSIQVPSLGATDADWIRVVSVEHPPRVVSRGKIHYANRLPGFIGLMDCDRVGLATYQIEGDECEIITLNILKKGIGVGTALVEMITLKPGLSFPEE